MKKIFLGIIVGLILCGGVVYGVNTYESNTIEYSPTDSSWEVSNVNEAINSLYSNLTELENIKNTDAYISLGTGTSFDVSSYAGYQNFTIDNFMIKINNVAIVAIQTDSNSHNRSYNYSGNLIPSLSYDPTTGIATISNTAVQTTLKLYASTGSVLTVTTTCELLLKNN